jgi:hypothetical protein
VRQGRRDDQGIRHDPQQHCEVGRDLGALEGTLVQHQRHSTEAVRIDAYNLHAAPRTRVCRSSADLIQQASDVPCPYYP